MSKSLKELRKEYQDKCDLRIKFINGQHYLSPEDFGKLQDELCVLAIKIKAKSNKK